MARLQMLRPSVSVLRPAVSYLDTRAMRDRLQDYRAWYKTARWQALRWSVLVRDHVTCQLCGQTHETLTALCRDMAGLGLMDAVKGKAPGFVADHRRPHRGDAGLFWDETNLQCLCKACHDSAKQRQEVASRAPDATGWGG